jgi:stage III sporulation protein SpoIIIAA
METTQRKTASEIQQQHESLKKEVMRAIESVIEEKEITSIRLNTGNFITIRFIDKYSYLQIVGINKEDVATLDQYESEDKLTFEELDLTELIEILDMLEGDISEITDDEDEE